MELVHDASGHIVFVLIIEGIVLLIACPREQIGGTETVVILEADDAHVHRGVKLEWEGLTTFTVCDADTWEYGLLVACHIAVVAGGVRRLLVIGVENLAQGQIGVVGHVVKLKAPAVEVVGANVCPVLPKLHHVNLVLGHQATAIKGRVDDAETILTARYPRGRDIFGLPAVECFSEGCMHGLCMLVLLSVETGCADGHQQECYDE